MKKAFVVLLIISLFLLGLFASGGSGSGPHSFEVATTVAEINKMKITVAKFTGTTESDFDSATAFEDDVVATQSGAQNFSAWISTLSNRSTGYKVLMGANPMVNTSGGGGAEKIHYTVTVGNLSIDTSAKPGGPGPGAKFVIVVPSLDALSSESKKITLSVDPTTFAQAVEGTYRGQVVFEFRAT